MFKYGAINLYETIVHCLIYHASRIYSIWLSHGFRKGISFLLLGKHINDIFAVLRHLRKSARLSAGNVQYWHSMMVCNNIRKQVYLLDHWIPRWFREIINILFLWFVHLKPFLYERSLLRISDFLFCLLVSTFFP